MSRLLYPVASSSRPAIALVALVGLLAACGDPSTGPRQDRVLWSTPAPALGQPAADSSTVYFGTLQHEVVAVDRATGAVRWRGSIPSNAPRTLGGANVVLAGDVAVYGDGGIHAFDRTTSEPRWTFDAVDPETFIDGAPGLFSMATDGVRIYTGSSRGHAYAVNSADGSPVWDAKLADGAGSSVSNPVVAAGTVYYIVLHPTIPLSGDLFALDAASGTVEWSRSYAGTEASPSVPVGPVAIAGDIVALGNADGMVHGLDHATGDELWTVPAPPEQGTRSIGRWVVLAGNMLVASSSTGLIVGLDPATGAQQWSTTASDGLPVGPMVADGNTIYVLLDNEQKMGAYDAQTGDELWFAAPPGQGVRRFGGLPLAGQDAIFIAGADALLALRK